MTKRVSDERLQECVDLSSKSMPVPDLNFQEFYAITSELAFSRAQLAAVTAQRDEFARMIATGLPRVLDGACASCFPHATPEQLGARAVGGFVCTYHKAKRIARAPKLAGGAS